MAIILDRGTNARAVYLVTATGADAGGKAAPLTITDAGMEYETVAASATAQVLGATGAVGDYLSHIVISPGTTSPGTVIILDGAIAVYTFTGGATSVPGLNPITVPLGALSVSGAWKITTGTNVTVAAFGDFT